MMARGEQIEHLVPATETENPFFLLGISVISDVPAKLFRSVTFQSTIWLEHVQKTYLLTAHFGEAVSECAVLANKLL